MRHEFGLRFLKLSMNRHRSLPELPLLILLSRKKIVEAPISQIILQTITHKKQYTIGSMRVVLAAIFRS